MEEALDLSFDRLLTMMMMMMMSKQNTHTHTQNMQYLFLFHSNNGYANAPQCYVKHTWSDLFMHINPLAPELFFFNFSTSFI